MITTLPDDVEAVRRDTVEFVCAAAALPPITEVTWTVDDSPISSNLPYNISTSTAPISSLYSTISTLTITSVQKELAGLYLCTFTSDIGETMAAAALSVIGMEHLFHVNFVWVCVHSVLI